MFLLYEDGLNIIYLFVKLSAVIPNFSLSVSLFLEILKKKEFHWSIVSIIKKEINMCNMLGLWQGLKDGENLILT
jgi:hypothetical protein